MTISTNRWQNNQFVFITAPDKPTPFVVICDHPTRRTVPVLALPINLLGSAWGTAGATAANWGNGMVCSPALPPYSGFSFTQPQWPTVGGTMKALHYDLFITETEAVPTNEWQVIEKQINIPGVAFGNPVTDLGYVRFRLDAGQDWCVGWCWGRSTRGRAGYSTFPVTAPVLGDLRQRFVADATEIIEFYQDIGQPDPDFLVVESRVHQDTRAGSAITIAQSAGVAGFTIGKVMFDGSGATGLEDACDYIDANYP